jgi:hypothetical protein
MTKRWECAMSETWLSNLTSEGENDMSSISPDDYGLPRRTLPAAASILPPSEPEPAPLRARDPIKLASVTIQAVDQIGQAAASEIEEAAHALESAAQEIGKTLRDLAAAVRGHSKIAGEHVESFCGKATTVIEGVRALQDRLDRVESNGNGHA